MNTARIVYSGTLSYRTKNVVTSNIIGPTVLGLYKGVSGHEGSAPPPDSVANSSVATGGHWWARVHHAPAMLGHGIRADPKSFFSGEGVGEIEDGFGNKPVWKLEKHLTAANCLHIWLLGASP